MQRPISLSDFQSGEISARRGLTSPASGSRNGGAVGFRELLRSVGTLSPMRSDQTASDYVIASGDTLSEIARRQLVESGRPVNGATIAREVERIARDNNIADPDRIFAGATVRLAAPSVQAVGSSNSRAPEPPYSQAPRLQSTSQPQLQRNEALAFNVGAIQAGSSAQAPVPPPHATSRASFPQLERTLDRAVERGYLSSGERQPVHDRIVQLSRKYQFSPDDFATVALMESDGLNPKATNGRCHGIIQFCEGAGRGAASVGMQGRAADITDMNVLQQLELVDRYFQDTRLGESGAVSLVDLYLTVLTPAARAERRADVPLDIAGRQAKVLYPEGDRNQPITRTSLVSGLVNHARSQLEPLGRIFSWPASNNPGPLSQRASPPAAQIAERRGIDGPLSDKARRNASFASEPGLRGADKRGRQG